MTEVTYCIPTHCNEEGLYLTIFAALSQLEKSNLNWEILVVADGGTPQKWENVHSNVHCIRLTGSNRTGSPQGTRNVGIQNAQYKNVLCVDSHVIVSDIKKWVLEHERVGAALSFPAMIGASQDMWKIYGSAFDWDSTFWNTHVFYQPKKSESYRVIQASHSGFMCDRQFYMDSGGYTNLQNGYGGEETFLALKAWMLGRENWMIPSVWHAHFQPAGRNEGAEVKENYKQNFCIAAYVFGGHDYLEKIERYYGIKLKITMGIEQERQKICAGPYQGNLNALRKYCERENIE